MNKKYLLGLGGLVAMATPLVAVISCGLGASATTDKTAPTLSLNTTASLAGNKAVQDDKNAAKGTLTITNIIPNASSVTKTWIENLVTAEDEIDKNIKTTSTWDKEFSGLRAGNYVLTVTAKDTASNTSTYELTVTVRDVIPPVITLKDPDATVGGSKIQNPSISYKWKLAFKNNKGVTPDQIQNLFKATDESDSNPKLIFDWSPDFDGIKKGVFKLTISSKDNANNNSNFEGYVLTVTVSDGTAPVIALKDPNTLVGGAKVDLANKTLAIDNSQVVTAGEITGLFKATDENDDNPRLIFGWDEPFDGNKKGTYKLTVTATDTDNNDSTYVLTVTVNDGKAPVIALKNADTEIGGAKVVSSDGNTGTLTFDNAKRVTAAQITGLFKVTDESDGESNLAQSDFSWDKAFNGTKKDTYTLTVKTKDTSQNQSNTYTLTVIVTDTTAPVIALKNPDTGVSGAKVDWVNKTLTFDNTKGVTAAQIQDLFKATDDGGDIVPTFNWAPEFEVNKKGVYKLTVTATDGTNTSTYELTVTVT